MNLKTRYVVKGLGKEQTINSVITILTDEQGKKIQKVEDKWDGKLPEGSIAQVSFSQLLNPFWWTFYLEAWLFWLWSLIWYTKVWRVRAALSFLPRPFELCCICALLTPLFSAGIPSLECRHCAQHHQRAQEQGRGCKERKLEVLPTTRQLRRGISEHSKYTSSKAFYLFRHITVTSRVRP